MSQGIKSAFKQGDILTGGFGITVAMWVTGYFFRLPMLQLPSFLLFFALLLCLLLGGYFLGLYSKPGWKRGLYAGLLSSALNLLILGSLLSEGPVWMAFLWIPGFFAVSAMLTALGGAIGEYSSHVQENVMWKAKFAVVTCVATFFLLIAGGLVTSQEAGLAVVDWPNSFGYNMFLYPLSHMTGGIYYEHAHRLFGSLVGLTTIALALHFWAVEPRPWLRWLVFVCLYSIGHYSRYFGWVACYRTLYFEHVRRGNPTEYLPGHRSWCFRANLFCHPGFGGGFCITKMAVG